MLLILLLNKMATVTLFNFGFISAKCNDCGSSDSSDSSNEDSDLSETTEPPRKKPKREFKRKWIEKWPQVRYDNDRGIMFCAICEEVSISKLNDII